MASHRSHLVLLFTGFLMVPSPGCYLWPWGRPVACWDNFLILFAAVALKCFSLFFLQCLRCWVSDLQRPHGAPCSAECFLSCRRTFLPTAFLELPLVCLSTVISSLYSAAPFWGSVSNVGFGFRWGSNPVLLLPLLAQWPWRFPKLSEVVSLSGK